jgi:hypothetical protein
VFISLQKAVQRALQLPHVNIALLNLGYIEKKKIRLTRQITLRFVHFHQLKKSQVTPKRKFVAANGYPFTA